MYMYVQKSYVHEKIKGSKNDQKKKNNKKANLKSLSCYIYVQKNE